MSKFTKIVAPVITVIATVLSITLFISNQNLNHKVDSQSKKLTKLTKQKDALAFDKKLSKDDASRKANLEKLDKKNDQYTIKLSAQQAAESGAKSSTVVINNKTLNSTVSSDVLNTNDKNTLYQSANTSNFRYFAHDDSDTNYSILNLRPNDTIKINDKTYRVSTNQTFVSDKDAAQVYANDDPYIAIFFIRDASGYANMITAKLVAN